MAVPPPLARHSLMYHPPGLHTCRGGAEGPLSSPVPASCGRQAWSRRGEEKVLLRPVGLAGRMQKEISPQAPVAAGLGSTSQARSEVMGAREDVV